MSNGRHRARPVPSAASRLLTAKQRPRWALAGTVAVIVLTVSVATAATPDRFAAQVEVAQAQSGASDLLTGRDGDIVADRGQDRAPTTDPPPEITAVMESIPEVTGQLWVTQALNVRTGPSTDHELVGTAPAISQVDVTGNTKGDWTQVIWDGEVAWVHSGYLSDTKPEAAPAAPAGVSGAACSKNPGLESSLSANASAAYRAVCAAFPAVSSFGGYRAGDSGDHGSGNAVDIMITGDAGWQVARYLQANASALGVKYVIFEQQIWLRGDAHSDWEWMEDRGGATANHYDHVHVSVN
ncbi:MAG: SH3 domain-containing protein [Beutenbergiaceae bacterium]